MTRTGYFWTYISSGTYGYTFYDYRDSRTATAPLRSSKGFRIICRRMLTHPTHRWWNDRAAESSHGRLAHGLRAFDAGCTSRAEAQYVLGLIGQSYDIENECRPQGPEVRWMRATASMPFSVASGRFSREKNSRCQEPVRQGHRLDRLNHWPELCRFTASGVLEIDNNMAE